jgi:hypothetical protein
MMMHCKQSQFEPAGEAHLAEDVGQVALDRILADGERQRDVFICTALDNRRDDLHLARGQAEGLALRPGSGPRLERFHPTSHRLLANPVLPLADGVDCRATRSREPSPSAPSRAPPVEEQTSFQHRGSS